MAWYFYVGLIAAICIAIFSTPQLIKTIKTKHTEGLSVIMLLLMVFGDFCFALNGIGILAGVKYIPDLNSRLSSGLPLLLANVIAFTISAILLFLKLRSMHYAKIFKTTEKQFCDNYESYRTKIKMLKAEKQSANKVEVPSDPQEPIVG